ncbi:uncharacterized protein PV06_11211 [Exophiala oligosperma]|uniref:Uncharacterized protein n=1 Tax=Exophiala oligosperma TaxID=215243 RepID=A0A0D2A8C5_9EURO|nr:uncharacterized protein PV06_11211 [Exophiala oligosperma]KIW36561.1 hypothetical protein PV06_11211 [Exophiala oligosperma]
MASGQNDNIDPKASGLGISSGNPIPCQLSQQGRSKDPPDGTQSRRYLDELLEIQSLLNSILTVIRYGSKEETGGLLDCIRSGVSLSQIRYHLQSLGRFTQVTRAAVQTGEFIEDTVSEGDDSVDQTFEELGNG